MASQLRRTDDLQRLKTRELVLQGTDGSYAPASSILTVDGIGNVIAGATGAAVPTIYTTNIRPYPPGSTGACNISGRFTVNNEDTNDGADVTLIQMMQSDTGGTRGAIMYVVGEDSSGFGSDPNDKNQFCTYAYPKPARAPITKIESTPLMAGTTGPVGLTGGFGDKYFYRNMQVGGYVAAPNAQFEDVSVGSNLGIGVGSAVHALDVSGNVYIESNSTPSQVFTTPGRYTIRIPNGVDTVTVTLVGAGGGGSAGGYGGYIKGTFNAAAYVGQTMTIQVGAVGTPTVSILFNIPSQASFVSFLSGGPIIAMAGAGGCQGDNAGGHGGGGIGAFTAVTGGSVAIGTDGAANGTAGGGKGGKLNAGGVGGTADGTGSINGPSGSGRPGVETYTDVVGGFGFTTSAGGNGYTSGGAGSIVESALTSGAGGGGSSFIGSTFTLLSSLRGDDPTSYDGTVPIGVGRSGKSGYVSISYASQPSLYTSGDIVSGAGLRISAPMVPGSTGAAGSPGQIAWDTDYLYVCVGANSWKRTALAW
jgi:hypothetical protein